jgi:hypothetical protein
VCKCRKITLGVQVQEHHLERRHGAVHKDIADEDRDVVGELIGSFESTANGGDLVSHLIDILTGLVSEAQCFELIDFVTPNGCRACLEALDHEHDDDGSIERSVDELLEVRRVSEGERRAKGERFASLFAIESTRGHLLS